MRKLLIAFTLTVLWLVGTTAQAGAGSTCWVEPDPVSLTADEFYVVMATGLTPLAAYDIRVDQKNQSFGHHDDVSGVFTDEGGVLMATLGVDPNPRDFLVLGTATVHVRPSNSTAPKGRGGCQTSFTVVP